MYTTFFVSTRIITHTLEKQLVDLGNDHGPSLNILLLTVLENEVQQWGGVLNNNIKWA